MPDLEELLLAEAARERRPVDITYTSWAGRASERTLHPYGLVLHSGRWYVTGADSLRAQVRTFRLDRIQAVAPGTGTFDVPAGFDPTATVLAGLADVGYRHEVRVLLPHTTAEVVRDRLPAGLATVTQVDDGVRLTLRAERLDWAVAVLAWLGLPFVVEHPDELRDHVRALAELLTDAAQAALPPTDAQTSP